MANLPILFQELVKLPDLGIASSFCNSRSLTLESDKYVCVREETPTANTLVYVELQEPNTPITRRSNKADSVIMNPKSKVIALKSGRQLQIFNLDMKSKMKSYVMPDDIMYWHWINVNTVALVTRGAVYHWSMEGTAEPKKIFDRHPELAATQIVNYQVSADEKWLALTGLTQEDGRVAGKTQLFSVAKNVGQLIPAHAACFAQFDVEGSTQPSTVFVIANRDATGVTKLTFIEVERGDAPAAMERKIEIVEYPSDAVSAGDFPVAVIPSRKYGVVYLQTKYHLHIYDIESAKCMFKNRVSADVVFTCTRHESVDGILMINQIGQVLSVTLNPQTVVAYVSNTLMNLPLAIRLASRCNLPGAEDLVVKQFSMMFASGNYSEAARIAATSPQGILRTPSTIQRFQSIPLTAGQASPLFQYFGVLLDQGKLNKFESVELCRHVISQGKKELVQKWVSENKLECSEELGDMAKTLDVQLGLQIYFKAEVHHKVVQCFVELSQYDKIILYGKKVGFKPDYAYLLQTITSVDPTNASKFALMLVQQPEGPLMEPATIMDLFLQRSQVQQMTFFAVEYLKEDKPEHAALQTKVLEINLVSFPQVADALLTNKSFSHYDKTRIAQLCEKAGLYQHALEHYSDKEIKDIRRVLANAQQIDRVWLVEYLGTLQPDNIMSCLKDLIASRQNMQVVVQAATKYSELLTPTALIALFEKAQAADGLYLYLKSIVDFSQDSQVHFKYIVSAAKMNEIKEIERIVKDSSCYDPAEVKDFLKEARLADQLPLIIVCDRFNFVEDLAAYLYTNNMRHFIETYVQKVNTQKTPAVVGALLDIDASVDFVKNLINAVRATVPVEELTDVVAKKGKLKILQNFLEMRANEGAKDPATHNALAMIYVDTNNNPQAFLTNNEYYEPLVVGKHCEKRDPQLAFIAYKRGQCDEELVEMCQKNSLYKQLARYLVQRKSPDLWVSVLSNDNKHRKPLMDQLNATALPECSNHEEFSIAVSIIMKIEELKPELLELLDKVVLGTGQFYESKTLQELLLVTAIKADKSRVMEYINRLNNISPVDMARIAIGEELYEEAFTVYRKFEMHVEAVKVLLDNVGSVERATEYAERVSDAGVWSEVAKYQLNNEMIGAAIASYLKAEDPQEYSRVIEEVEREGNEFEALVEFLKMARKKRQRDVIVDTELVYALAKTNHLDQLEDLVSQSSAAQLDTVGARCFREKMYHAAKIIFAAEPDYQSLASTMLALSDFEGAVSAAKSASNNSTWKEVNAACIAAGEFRLAQVAAFQLVVQPDELDDVVRFYEERGYIDQLINVLDSALGNESSHKGLFTELAILYAKYKREKLMPHIKTFCNKINIAKVLLICRDACHWPELVFLYQQFDENDNAAITMMDHATEAWDAVTFKEVIVRVSNLDVYYRAIEFYLREQPMQLCDLLATITNKVDSSRVVAILRKHNALQLVKKYLTKIQPQNIQAVNEAVNDILIEEEDVDGLRRSITDFTTFDQISLAQRLEKHELLEMRRVAAQLYKQNQRWAQSVELSKKDSLYKDAMNTTAESQNKELAESLLKFFAQQPNASGGFDVNKECFAACLFTCNSLLRSDVVLELGWKYKMIDYVMPYMIQHMKEMNDKVAALEKEATESKKVREDLSAQQAAQQAAGLQAQITGYSTWPAGVSQQPTGMMPVAMPPVQPAYYSPSPF